MRITICDDNKGAAQRLKRWTEDYFGKKAQTRILTEKDDSDDSSQCVIELEIERDAFEKAMVRAEDRMTNQLNASMQIYIGKQLERVFFDQIIYAKSDVRKIHLKCTDEELSFYGKMKELEEKLAGYGFIRCHKSYIVNMEYIQSIDNRKITLLNGEQIPVSKARSYEAKLQIQKYLDDLK